MGCGTFGAGARGCSLAAIGEATFVQEETSWRNRYGPNTIPKSLTTLSLGRIVFSMPILNKMFSRAMDRLIQIARRPSTSGTADAMRRSAVDAESAVLSIVSGALGGVAPVRGLCACVIPFLFRVRACVSASIATTSINSSNGPRTVGGSSTRGSLGKGEAHDK
jgi:hypothetical protein